MTNFTLNNGQNTNDPDDDKLPTEEPNPLLSFRTLRFSSKFETSVTAGNRLTITAICEDPATA
jgi:hypothetical protein